MQHPFQCIATALGDENLLLAACGSSLVSTNLQTGEIVSEWTADNESTAETKGKAKDESIPQSSEPPAKRQKTSESPAGEPQRVQLEGKGSKQQTKNPSPSKSSTIILLAICPNQTYLAAVTEDKCIRVFSLRPTLQEIGTAREFPKRPCAIQIPPSNDTILVADKHGDVYSLPLIQTETIPKPKLETVEEKFKPSATPLTVHSKRNLTALQAQQAQKQFTPRKDVLGEFDNTLLLGHVSMLTDMKFLSLPGEKKQWLATCDRDEHIRISRAPPQSYVIEGFCLGHESFLSRVCQVGTKLVSGGGDEWLGIWDFQTNQLERKIDLTALTPEGKVAVSGIWRVEDGIVFVLEKVKSVFYVPKLDGKVSVLSTGRHSPLDVVVLDHRVVVSIDSREAGSLRLLVIDLKSGTEDVALTASLAKLNSHVGKELSGPAKQLDDLLYNVANLRKRGALEGGGGVAEEEGAFIVEED